ncbi:MAG: hypothetical protein IJC48_08960 [Clostridia bacterium]|nr:hypothetical protein [Clostridia bacterium]
MALSKNDVSILKTLASEYAHLASLPIQKKKKEMWLRHNSLASERPMILIDQLPWNELNTDGSLNLQVEDPYFRGVEDWMRKEIYKWKHFPADMVLDEYIKLPRPISSTGWGLEAEVERLYTDETGDVAAQRMTNLIQEEEDVEKIKSPVITLDVRKEKEIRQTAEEIFAGILPVRMTGMIMHLGAWDTIAYWMGVEACYIELIDRPEMMHAVMEKMVKGYLDQIDQLNALGAFDSYGHYCHCSHTYHPDDKEKEFVTSKDTWAFGLAQLFTSVSPRITQEFECDYMEKVFCRFGSIYYGCCDRLDDRLEKIVKLPNVKKISCSPWSDREKFSEKLPKGFIMSNKPTPAYLAMDTFDEDAVRRDIRRTVDAAKKNDVKLEMILKDVSTVRYHPERLTRFSEIAIEETER